MYWLSYHIDLLFQQNYRQFHPDLHRIIQVKFGGTDFLKIINSPIVLAERDGEPYAAAAAAPACSLTFVFLFSD